MWHTAKVRRIPEGLQGAHNETIGRIITEGRTVEAQLVGVAALLEVAKMDPTTLSATTMDNLIT